MKSQIRNIIIFVAIGLVFVFIYLIFIKGDNKEVPALVGTTSLNTSSTKTPTSAKDSEIAQDFLTLLLNVKNITLNDAIFSDKAFMSLHDSSILLVPDGNEGRPNPFAPIGTDVGNVPIQSTPVAPPVTNTGNSIKNEASSDFDFGGSIDFSSEIPGVDQILTN